MNTDQKSEWGAAAGHSAVGRLSVSFAGGLVAGIATSFVSPWALAVLVGWDLTAAIFLIRIWLTIWKMDPDSTCRHANREDPSRALADAIIVMAAIACLGAVGFILEKAASSGGGTKAFYLAVGVVSVVFAWASVHSVFTLRYAAIFYNDPIGGVDFNQKDRPQYSDFAYLAFTLGMTFQVSDTDLTIETIRRAALRHALLSYLFGAVIVGLVINVVASLLH